MMGRHGSEAAAVVVGFDDIALMGEPVEERGGHLGVTEGRGPLAEGQLVVTITEVCS